MECSQLFMRPKLLILACSVLLALPLTLIAAPISGKVGAPNAGKLLQQLQPQNLPLQFNNASLTQQAPSPNRRSRDTTPILVNVIKLRGNTVFSTASLHQLVASGEKHQLTLPQLEALAQRIANYYHAHDYPLAQAIVPPQVVVHHTILIEIVEGYYGKITLKNRSEANCGLLQATLSALSANTIVKQQPLTRTLLLMSDIPGTNVHATLSPGQIPKTTNLAVTVDPTHKVWGHIGVDNYTDPYTGHTRGLVGIGVNDLLHWGDVLTIDGITTGHDLSWGNISYQAVINGTGTQAGTTYSTMDYHLNGLFEPLRAHGTANLFGTWLSQPFIRSKTLNFYGHLEYQHRHLDDILGAVDWHDARHLNSVKLDFIGDVSDPLWRGGLNRFILSTTYGRVTFDNAVAQAVDAATAKTQGGYFIWRGGVNRLQNLTTTTQLYLAYAFQYANKNVDSAEQFLLGGPDTIRGYQISTLGGASGELETIELRQWFPIPLLKLVQASAFFDAGQLTIHEDPFANIAIPNHANLMSVGLGLSWSNSNYWSAKIMAAHPVGPEIELLNSRPSTLVWFLLNKQFA